MISSFSSSSGGLVSHSGHPSDPTNKAVGKTLKECQKITSDATVLPQRALSLEYRLAGKTSFPGILLDVLAGYLYLLEECGFEAKNVIVMGDSAGALLALALARYLRDEKLLEQPGGLVLLSVSTEMKRLECSDSHRCSSNSMKLLECRSSLSTFIRKCLKLS